MIEWLWPWAFLLAPLPVLVRLLASPVERQQAALTVPSVAAFRAADDSAGPASGRFPWRTVALWLVWLALVTATARPQWTGDPVTLPVTGRDLMLAVDISGSMGTEDLELGGRLVNRLTVVKNVVGQFVDARRGDRVGLILFGTNAYLQAPLTFDLNSVNRLLVEAPVGIAGGKTAIGDAIGLAVKRLRSRPEGERVLILLTDGASNVGEVAPVKAAELARQEEIRIHTIGVGADEMRMPSLFGVFGSRVINPSAELDEETLRSIADTTGGRYFRAQNTQRLQEIYTIIDALEPLEQDAETYRPVAALYYWPLGAAWFLAMVLIAGNWRGWGRD
ncbi:MAG: VWA domain-containing protein [Pseudomonadales bacterium]|nr:VWA domain-containing protein [Pseudomonadales bacterium]NIX09550.1 VWA domain-containing protein [Pseudomonadales bacterium]